MNLHYLFSKLCTLGTTYPRSFSSQFLKVQLDSGSTLSSYPPPSNPRDANSCTVLLQAEISRHSSGRKASRFSGVITLHPPRSTRLVFKGQGRLEPNREVIQVTRSSVMGGLTGLPGSCQPVARVCWRLEVAAARKTVGGGWPRRRRRGENGGWMYGLRFGRRRDSSGPVGTCCLLIKCKRAASLSLDSSPALSPPLLSSYQAPPRVSPLSYSLECVGERS